jgi:5-methylcytosine-specific restriction protein A
MREELLAWMDTYPADPSWRDGTFAGAPAAATVSKAVPDAIRATGMADGYLVQGSAGKGDWTHTPWVAVLDPAETSTVEEGIYVVYLLSKGCERLYLTLNQGCTTLKDESGIPAARAELTRRSAVMRARLKTERLKSLAIDLNTDVWRADLYEHGVVLSTSYKRADLPSDGDLKRDLEEALRLYRSVLDQGGWAADDQITAEAVRELGEVTLTEAKVYRRHRQIERNPSHSRLVKQIQGTVCKGCGKDPAQTYGPIAAGMVEAHHLRPLSDLAAGETVTFDPRTDFAVLCPTCHRVIHRLEDAGDLEALRALVLKHS